MIGEIVAKSRGEERDVGIVSPKSTEEQVGMALQLTEVYSKETENFGRPYVSNDRSKRITCSLLSSTGIFSVYSMNESQFLKSRTLSTSEIVLVDVQFLLAATDLPNPFLIR
jgi:hypothetical protein